MNTTFERLADLTPGVAPAAPSVAPRGAVGGQVVLLLLVDVAPGSRLWGYARFVLGSLALRGVRGLRFSRQLGSGYEGGFGVRPSGTRQGLFLAFDDESAADAFARSPLADAYRRHAREICLVKLAPYSARGSWGGTTLTPGAVAPSSGPVAALTRASIRPLKAARFWTHAPKSQLQLESAQGCRLAVGLGEAPLFRQATFSLWDSLEAMNAYARTGAHQEAIRQSMGGDFFSESMFVRFVPLSVQGTWKGRTLG